MIYKHTDLNENDFRLDPHLISLLQDVPFWAELSRHITKIPTRDMPTAGIAFDPELDEICLYWNPDFFKELTPWQVRAVLTHEFYHFVFGHLGSRRRQPPKLWNIATDLAINSLIMDGCDSPKMYKPLKGEEALPGMCLIPGRWPTPPDGKKLTKEMKAAMPVAAAIASFPKNESSEGYFSELMKVAKQVNSCPVHGMNSKKQKTQKGNAGQQPDKGDKGEGDNPDKNGENGEGKNPGENGDGQDGNNPGGCGGQCQEGDCSGAGCSGGEGHDHGDGDQECTCGGDDWVNSFDDHDGWEDMPEESREYIEGRAKAIIEQAVKRADQRADGWGSIPSEIREQIRLSVSSIINWRQVLRQFVGSINRGNRTKSIKRINKRYPYIHPGNKRGYVAKLLVAVDQSGSVDDQMLTEFFAELSSLSKKMTVDVIHFDTECFEKDLQTWRRGSVPKAMRTRCGGTDFNAPTRYANDPKNRGRWDGLLICTDGECEAPGASRLKRGWVIGKGQKLLFNTSEIQISLDNTKPLTGAWR